jgi:hypothetical protein
VSAPIFNTGDVPSATQVDAWMVNTTWARKTADESITSSTTQQDDDTLFVSVVANSTYIVEMVLQVRSATGTTAGIAWQFVAPAGATLFGGAVGLTPGSTTNTTPRVDTIALGGPNGHGSVGTSTNAAILADAVLIVGGTAGTFKLQWAQNVSNGTATTVKTGSYLRLRQVE